VRQMAAGLDDDDSTSHEIVRKLQTWIQCRIARGGMAPSVKNDDGIRES
jgi:hypothetical protein